MTRAKSAVFVIACLAGGTAYAADQQEPRVQAALACTSIKSDEARLRCYDQAVANLRQAIERGELIAERSTQPSSLEGVIAAAGERGFNRFWVVLDNGDRWEVVATSSHDPGPRKGQKVKLKKTRLGGYWFDEPGYAFRRAKFLGRSNS